MKTTRKAKPSSGAVDEIAAYAQEQTPSFRTICELLRKLIDTALPKATSKVWHGSPVWFDGDNPVVGYSTSAKAVKLLFWNGRALDEPAFKPVGKYQAAEAVFGTMEDVDAAEIRRWLKKAKANVFDSKAFFQKLRAKK